MGGHGEVESGAVGEARGGAEVGAFLFLCSPVSTCAMIRDSEETGRSSNVR